MPQHIIDAHQASAYAPLQPMEPVLRRQATDDAQWLWQVKWDGVRMLVDRRGDCISLWNRKGRLRTPIYPDVVAEVSTLSRDDLLLDGEMIALGPDGLPNFRRVLQRDLAQRPKLSIAVVYMTFDCLRLDGRSLLDQPLETRLEALRTLSSGEGLLQPCDSFEDGAALFAHLQQAGLEGVVGKRRGSRYIIGAKSPLWQKVKCWRRVTVQAVAIAWQDGRPASLLLGEQVDDRWVEVGSASSGLTADMWRALTRLGTGRPAPAGGGARSVDRLQHPVPVTVRFMEWTEQGRLRSPVIERIHWPT